MPETLSFNPGDGQDCVSLIIIDDGETELCERFRFMFTTQNPSVTLPTSPEITINDNDG